MKFNFLIIMAMLTTLSSGCKIKSSYDNNPLISMDESAPKNFYALSFSSNGCNFRILVNDVLVIDFFDTGGGTGMTPINSSILKSGIQRLKIELYPVKGHEEKGINSIRPLDIFVKCKDNELSFADYETILTNPLNNIEIPLGIPYFEYECTFEAEVPYVLQGWSNCKDLRDEPNLEEQVIEKLNELKILFENKDYDRLTDIMLYKQNSASYSIYRSVDEGKEQLLEMFDKMKVRYDEIAEFKDYKITFMGDGKLVYVENIFDRDPALRLVKDKRRWPIQILLGKREGSDELEVIK